MSPLRTGCIALELRSAYLRMILYYMPLVQLELKELEKKKFDVSYSQSILQEIPAIADPLTLLSFKKELLASLSSSSEPASSRDVFLEQPIPL